MSSNSPSHLIHSGKNNKIASVTVFPNAAQVTRKIETEVKKGRNKIQIEILSASVNSESLNCKVTGSGMQMSVQYKRLPAILPPQPEMKDLELKREELQRKHRNLKKRKNVFEKQVLFLDSSLDFAQTQVPKDIQTNYPSSEKIQSTLDLLDKNYTTLYQKMEDYELQLDELKKEIEQIERTIAQQKPTSQPDVKIAELVFDSDKDQEVSIELSYLTGRASWQHYYKINVSDDLSEITLTMLANIRQNTLEDWEQAEIVLSNMQLQQNLRLPQAQVWHVAPYIPPSPMRAAAAIPAGAMPLEACEASADLDDVLLGSADGASDDFFEPEVAEIAIADRKQMTSAEEYELPGTHDINSGADDSLVTLQHKTISGDFFHLLIPSEDPRAYLVCEIPHQNDWLPGTINLYWNECFLTQVPFEQADAGEKLKLNLGVDKEVVCKHQCLKNKVLETRMGVMERSQVTKVLEYKTTIENRKATEIKVKLFISVPNSTTDKIQIKDIKLSPEPNESNYDDQQGVNYWSIDLDSMKSQEVDYSFNLKYPKDMSLMGI